MLERKILMFRMRAVGMLKLLNDMGWTALVAYVVGALITHFYIYRNGEVENDKSANLISILWPIALCLYCILMIEHKIKSLFEYEDN